MNLKERAGLIATVSSALARGEHTLAVLPNLIRQILEEEAWREFETKMGSHVTYTNFEDFVTTPPLSGLGAKLETVYDIARSDLVLLDKLDQARGSHQGQRTDLQSNFVNNINEVARPQGTSKDRALRHLREKRPDLHGRVLAGDLSPHAAMREAKFRHPTMTVTLDSPKSAGSLVTRASPEFLDELRRQICGQQTAQEGSA